jgi:hypothetical protein
LHQKEIDDIRLFKGDVALLDGTLTASAAGIVDGDVLVLAFRENAEKFESPHFELYPDGGDDSDDGDDDPVDDVVVNK